MGNLFSDGLKFVGNLLMGVIGLLFKPLTGLFSSSSDNDQDGGGFLSGLLGMFGIGGKEESPSASSAPAPAPPDDAPPESGVRRMGSLQGPFERSVKGLEAFDPEFQGPLSRVMDRLREKGWEPKIGSGVRTQEQQDAKKAGGLSAVNHSLHQVGRAADIVDRRYGWDLPLNHQYWRDLEEAALAEGLVSGARWTKEKHGIGPDPAHVQLGRGVVTAEAVARYNAGRGTPQAVS